MFSKFTFQGKVNVVLKLLSDNWDNEVEKTLVKLKVKHPNLLSIYNDILIQRSIEKIQASKKISTVLMNV